MLCLLFVVGCCVDIVGGWLLLGDCGLLFVDR